MELADFHIHSTYSDGSFSPSQLIDLALQNGLKGLALTDHDTVAGLDEFLDYGRKAGMDVITGLEITCQYGDTPVHLLGYCFDHRNPDLLRQLAVIQQARVDRNRKILDKLHALGIHLVLEELEHTSNGQIGRPHIATALVRKKVVQTVQMAFEHYIKKGRPAYFPRRRFPVQEAITMIRRAGGLAILAHPLPLVKDYGKNLPVIVRELQNAGLAGIETSFPSANAKVSKKLVALASQLGLLISGGSDFHGDLKPDAQMINRRGKLQVGYDLLQQIKDAASQNTGC